MKSDTTLALALVATGVAVVGLVAWGRSRAAAAMGKDDPGGPGVTPIGPFPDLKVGTLLLVDSAAAALPPPFSAAPQLPAVVDMVLQDPLLVSVSVGTRDLPGSPFFSGTIPRSAILRVLAPPPPTVFT